MNWDDILAGSGATGVILAGVIAIYKLVIQPMKGSVQPAVGTAKIYDFPEEHFSSCRELRHDIDAIKDLVKEDLMVDRMTLEAVERISENMVKVAAILEGMERRLG